jgi:hypothetical protein
MMNGVLDAGRSGGQEILMQHAFLRSIIGAGNVRCPMKRTF